MKKLQKKTKTEKVNFLKQGNRRVIKKKKKNSNRCFCINQAQKKNESDMFCPINFKITN